MTNLTTIAGIAITALCTGILSGALLWQRYVKARAPAPVTAGATTPLLWDIHSLLNAMNRFAVAAERGNSIDPALVYNLSDYLLHSSMLQREAGWAEPDSVENWLLAHMRILGELRGQHNMPTVTMKVPASTRRFDATDVVRQMLWFLQRAHTIDLIEIQLRPHLGGHTSSISIAVYGTMEELDSVPIEDLSSVWRLTKGKCTCALKAACEPLGPGDAAAAA